MKNENYYIGLDIGTDSVGYAVTDEEYRLCKHRGEPMWGVTLFDEAQLAAERRGFRTARRRLDRRQQRVKLLAELFVKDIVKTDESFFKRIKESYLYPEDKSQKVRLFGTYEEQKAYAEKYPTIHHLIYELMHSTDSHDPRLVFLACAWLVAHRGHFLSEVDKHKVDEVTDFKIVWKELTEYALPWDENIDIFEIEKALRKKLNVTNKSKVLTEVLFGGKKSPKEINSVYEYNYDLTIKLLCGGSVKLKDLFGKDAYADIEKNSLSLGMKDEDMDLIMQSVEESDAEFISALKAVYDWSVLVDILKGKESISEAKVEIFNQHQKDLKLLKDFIKKYIPQKHNDIFRSKDIKNNYVSYIGKTKTANRDVSVKKNTSQEDFCKYILSVMKSVKPKKMDGKAYGEMISRLEVNDFMPKQVTGDNRVIPYQLYWHELNRILDNFYRSNLFI